MDDGLRKGWFHSVTHANGVGIGNSLVHVDLSIAGRRRDDLCTELLGSLLLDLLDVGHISLLSLGVLSTKGRFPQIIEFGFPPTWLLAGSSQMLSNYVNPGCFCWMARHSQ